MSGELSDITNWAAHMGVWDFSNGRRVYKSPEEPQWPFGICVSNVSFSQGTARATIRFAEVGGAVEVSGRLLFGWRSLINPYLSIGLGGGGRAYCVYQYDPASGWVPLALTGSRQNLIANHPYKLSVRVEGQRVLLEVDSVQVLEHVLETPLPQGQFGLFAWGTTSIEFTNTSVTQAPGTEAPTAKLSDIVILKPTLWGMGIDLPKAWKWVHDKWRGTRPPIRDDVAWLAALWHDPVWSKVIATGITAGISGLAALIWFFGAGLHTDHAPPSTNQHAVPASTPSTERTNPAPTPPPQSPVPDVNRPIAWRDDLSFWTTGNRLLGVVVRGTITNSAPVRLTDAYIISQITGEQKALQVEIAPGPQLEPIYDINPIPPNSLLQLWATFVSPGISPIDFVARWGSFRLYAEYDGIKYDKEFSRDTVQKYTQMQFPEVGPHVTPKGQSK
jgi:hypothetical protein